jgi:F0F1-type ATP synthase membrane subunit a
MKNNLFVKHFYFLNNVFKSQPKQKLTSYSLIFTWLTFLTVHISKGCRLTGNVYGNSFEYSIFDAASIFNVC